MSGSISIRFEEALRELESFGDIAKFFIERNEGRKISQFRSELASFQTSGRETYEWEIAEKDAIRTKTARDYEPDSRGMLVYATVSTIWSIEKDHSIGKNRAFKTTGKASTTVCIFDAKDDTLVVDWNLDLGDATSPGCHFHAQFGDSLLPVPRFASLSISPAAAMEYALSELFQKEWALRSGGAHQGASHWRRIQRNRILCFLQWTHDLILRSSGSPWVEYKAAKPPADLFLTRAVKEGSFRAC